jgi:hypothetical protein
MRDKSPGDIVLPTIPPGFFAAPEKQDHQERRRREM